MKKRKRKQERKFLLLDKSSLLRLNSEQRKELDSKHTILYPPILFAESAQHGLDQPSALFYFKNTVNVLHWAQRAKLDLLEGVPSRRYKIGAKISTMSVFEEPKEKREEIEKKASDFVNKMDASEKELKKHVSVLFGGEHTKLIDSLVMNHDEIPDENLLREFAGAIRELRGASKQFGLNPLSDFFNLRPDFMATLIGQGRRSIPAARQYLNDLRDGYEAYFKVDTLEKACRWVSQSFYYDTEAILSFLCRVPIIPLTAEEHTEIYNRFKCEGEPHINDFNDFAPYARAATQLYLTIFLYLSENRDNSSPSGALRDFEYLYYAIDANVTFISSDKWHKWCIEEIPILEPIRKNFKFLPHISKDEEEHRKVLNSIGLRA